VTFRYQVDPRLLSEDITYSLESSIEVEFHELSLISDDPESREKIRMLHYFYRAVARGQVYVFDEMPNP